jgi:single-stranded-DNA-specific exonuclease
VADIVPLLGENRILVKYGMEMLKKQLRPGVNALIQHARVESNIQPSDITFKLAPRLNAAGRLGNASSALALMTADNIVDAYEYAAKLDEFNQRRQAKEQEIFQQAKAQVESAPGFASNMSIIAAGENWHQGVIGIVASRFARDYNRPTIVLTIIGNEAHGSGRSVGNLNLIKILSRCSHLLTRFGGHPMAVGLGMNKDKIGEFQQEFEKCVREEAQPSDLINYINYDGVVRLSELNEEFFHYHGMLGPFGHGNPQPLYLIRGLEISRLMPIRPVHTKGVFTDEYGSSCDFIAFNKHLDPGTRWDIIGQPQINEYYGERKRQLQVIDFRPSAD